MGRKLFIALLLALVLADVAAWAGYTMRRSVGLASGAGGGGCDTSHVTFWWRAENSTTLDASKDYSAGDTTAAATGAGPPSFSVSAAKNGTHGVLTPSPNNYYLLSVSSDNLISGTKGCMAAWAQYTAWPGSGREVMGARKDSTHQLRMYISGSSGSRTSSLTMQDGTGTTTTVTTTGTNQTNAGNWFFYVGCWDASQSAGSDTLYVEVYNTSLSLVASGYNSTATLTPITSGDITELRLGSVNGSGTVDVYHDHFLVYDIPLASPTTCANQANYDGS